MLLIYIREMKKLSAFQKQKQNMKIFVLETPKAE